LWAVCLENRYQLRHLQSHLPHMGARHYLTHSQPRHNFQSLLLVKSLELSGNEMQLTALHLEDWDGSILIHADTESKLRPHHRSYTLTSLQIPRHINNLLPPRICISRAPWMTVQPRSLCATDMLSTSAGWQTTNSKTVLNQSANNSSITLYTTMKFTF